MQPGQLQYVTMDQDMSMMDIDMSIRQGPDFSMGDFGVRDIEAGRRDHSISEFPTDTSFGGFDITKDHEPPQDYAFDDYGL